MKSSVIICAYTLDRWNDLVAAIESCQSQTIPAYELILVVDYNAELEQRAREVFVDVLVVPNHLAKGLSGARNSGVLASRGDVLIFLDDDAYAESTWLELLCAPLKSPDVVGSGGWILPAWPQESPRWFPSTFLWVLGCSYDGLPGDGDSIRNPIGASMAMKREIFDTVGGFTDGIGRVGTVPLGCEETELCIRYSHERPTHRFVLARGAVVHHRVPESRLTSKYFLSRCWAEGLSKAVVSSLVGTDSGLSAERRHVLGAIPREIFYSLTATASEPREQSRRLMLIVLGSMTALAGLLRGTVATRRHPIQVNPVFLQQHEKSVEGELSVPHHEASPSWRPISLVRVELDAPVASIYVPDGFDDRVWLEASRGGVVVGRDEVTAIDRVVTAEDISSFTQRFADIETPVFNVPDDELPTATVVVPTICRHPEELVATVSHVLSMDYPRFDVIVVDNRRHDDGSFPDLSFDERVRVLVEPRPGASAARNRGYRAATGDFVAFTDDDVAVDPGWLRALGSRFARNPEVDAIGGLVLPAELATEPQLWFEEYYGGFSQNFKLDICDASSHPEDPLFPYAAGRFGAGCNMAFRLTALERLSGFHEDLGTGTLARGGEDLAAFFELVTAGGTVAFEPAALVRHFHRRTIEEFEQQVYGYGVGLAAFYTREILHRPSHLIELVRRFPAVLRWLLRSGVERSPTGTTHYPSNLRSLQLRGILWGPIAYLRSSASLAGRLRSGE